MGELERIGHDRQAISLYVHVPFCKSLCWYCGCNVIATRNAERGTGYVDQLATEMTLLARPLHGVTISEIAIGGGSPNFLSPSSMRTLFAAIDGYFSVASDARRSIELDPRTTTSAQVDVLAGAKFRSLSMGVQDFSEAVQNAIYRHQMMF
jgi:oxygen-independent coproporphyrinogen-3 oxidase